MKQGIDLKDDYMNEDMCDIVTEIVEQLTDDAKLKFARIADELSEDNDYLEGQNDFVKLLHSAAFAGIWAMINNLLINKQKKREEHAKGSKGPET